MDSRDLAETNASTEPTSSVYTHKIEIPGDGEYIAMMRDDGGHDLLRRLRDVAEDETSESDVL